MMPSSVYTDLIEKGYPVFYANHSRHVKAANEARTLIKNFVDNKCKTIPQRAAIVGVVEKIVAQLAASPETGLNNYSHKMTFFFKNTVLYPSYLADHDTRFVVCHSNCGQFFIFSLYYPKVINDCDHIVWKKARIHLKTPLPLYQNTPSSIA